MRRVLILGAVLAASIATARAQPWCMAYMPLHVNGAAILCPPDGSLDLKLTPEQFDYFKRRDQAMSRLIVRADKECPHFGGDKAACEDRIAREIVPPPTPEAMRFLARFGFTEETAR